VQDVRGRVARGAGLDIAAVLVVQRVVAETMGKSLEDIEAEPTAETDEWASRRAPVARLLRHGDRCDSQRVTPPHSRAPVRVSQVLREDAALVEDLAPSRREEAARVCVAQVATIPSGPWPRREWRSPTLQQGLGLLVLDGLLLRRVGVNGRFGAELLGAGDLLRPWQGEDEEPSLPVTSSWRVLHQTRVAVLDLSFARRVSSYPEVTGRLVGRALQRARHLAVVMAIVHQPRVDIRLHMLLWHLAFRWGRVTPEGILLPMRLTHSVLADLVASRRQSVTSGLARLAQRDLVRAQNDSWLLCGRAPGELLEVDPGSVPTPLGTA
jgi:CRP/FNR family cyclic AMP-dependent transcriptional regulator